MGDRVSIDRRGIFEAIDVDHEGFPPFPIHTARERFDAALAAELVIDLVGVEMVGHQMLGIALKGEVSLRNRLHDPAQTAAARTIAIAHARQIRRGCETNRATMALALKGLLFHHPFSPSLT
jgi:hypothetical protein